MDDTSWLTTLTLVLSVTSVVLTGLFSIRTQRLSAELDGRTYEYDDWSPTTTVLEHLESKGIKAPYSCREGECSACAFRLLEGEVKMLKNDVLEPEDLDDGIRLGCQSVPVTDQVSITYA